MKAMKTNLVLAFVLFILGTFYYWYEYQKKPAEEKTEETKKKVFMVDQNAEIDSIQVKFKDKEKSYDIDFSCKENCRMSATNGKWFITNPIKFSADDANIGSLLSSFGTLTVTESVPIEGDLEANLAKFGLSKDKREQSHVTVKYKTQTVSLYLGDDAAVDGSVYAYVEAQGLANDRVRMIPSYVKGYLTRTLSYWRNKKIFNFAASQIEKITLVNQNLAVQTELTKEGTDWFLPYKIPADNEVVDTFTTGIAFLNAKEFVSDNKSKDRTKFKFSSKAKYRLHLKVGASKTDSSQGPQNVTLDVYEGSAPTVANEKTSENAPTLLFGILADKDFIVELDKPSTDKFGKKPSEFKYKHLIYESDKKSIRRMKITFPKASTVTELKADEAENWTYFSGNTVEKLETAQVTELIKKINGVKISEFLPMDKIPSGYAEESVWEIRDAKGKSLRSFSIYKSEKSAGSDIYLKSTDRLFGGEIAKTEKLTISGLPSKPENIIKKKEIPVVKEEKTATPGHQ